MYVNAIIESMVGDEWRNIKNAAQAIHLYRLHILGTLQMDTYSYLSSHSAIKVNLQQYQYLTFFHLSIGAAMLISAV